VTAPGRLASAPRGGTESDRETRIGFGPLAGASPPGRLGRPVPGGTKVLARHVPWVMLLLCAGTAMAAPATRLAWLHDGTLQSAQRGSETPAPADARVPLGSVWKLFVYGYLHSRALQEPVYRCDAVQRQHDEEYCCDPGGSVGRDQALARSCGPYFDPKRLGLSAGDWAGFWRGQQAPAWVQSLPALQPGTQVTVAELLQALQHMPDDARIAAREALLPVTLRDEEVLGALGSGPRFKSWSWRIESERAGGAAGWLADGTPFWFGAGGTSRSALHAHARWIASQLQAGRTLPPMPDAAAVAAQPCVEVAFFQRYPLRSVRRANGSEAPAGPMRGRHTLQFDSGSALAIDAVPALQLARTPAGPVIEGRFALEDYVARVVDREGRAPEAAAARALAVAARSYVLQNAAEEQGCRRIADSSQAQRVSPNLPSEAARAAAAFTDGLVLIGGPVRYHSTEASPGVMSWQAAVEKSRQGLGFETILRQSYPRLALAGLQSAVDCEALPEAAQWLLQRQARWRGTLRAQPGYEPVAEGVQVCRLPMGTPHSDQRRLVIRVREWLSREGRVTLVHEYLHLAFRNHPNGRDEAFIEQLAQRLVDS